MIVTCPNCETKFNVPDDKYAPGRKARCSSCGHVFPLPELADDAYEREPVVSVQAAGAFDAPAPGDLPEDEALLASRELDDVVLPRGIEPLAPAPRKRTKMLALAAAGVVCLLILLGYGGYKVFSSFSKPAPDTTASTKDTAQQEMVKHLALENVRQYVVTNNEKAGRMVVVEGKVVNNFTTPKELILLEVTLYDDKGKPVAVRQQYCGIVLSLFQLQILSKQELEDALKNQVEILTNNTNIQPKKEVPFLTIFFSPPENTYEFGVKIIGVQNPAPKK